MNDFRNSRDSRPRPVYRDRRSQPGRPRTAPKKNLFANKSPEGSEQWLKPWVELKYFTYNPAVFPRMLGSVSGEIAPGSLVNVYDKNGELFGAGFWNEYSRTPLRMVHHGKDAFAERDLDAALERAVKLRREVLHPLAEADLLQHRRRVKRILAELCRDLDILQRRQVRYQIIKLEHEADVGAFGFEVAFLHTVHFYA